MRGFLFFLTLASCASFSLATNVHDLSGTADTTVTIVSPGSGYGLYALGDYAGVRGESNGGNVGELGSSLAAVWANAGGGGPAVVAYGYSSTGVFTMGYYGIEAYAGDPYASGAIGLKTQASGDYPIGIRAWVPSGINSTGVSVDVGSSDNYSQSYGVKASSGVSGTYATAFGLSGEGLGGGGSNDATGVYGSAHDAGGTNWGIYAIADGNANYGQAVGVYATASDPYGSTAGIFNGDVIVSSTCYCYPSDQKLKKNVRPIDKGLSTVMALQPKAYDMKVEEYKGQLNLAKGPQLGMIAQEVEKIVPEAVSQVKIPARKQKDKDGKTVTIDAIDYKTLNYVALIPVLVKAIQEQEAKIDALEKQLAAK